jgi:VWFA-related protein
MNRTVTLVLTLIASFCLSALGQTPPVGQQHRSDEDEVVRISTKLVQVDAVVTDKKGNLITDLNPEDFEVYEDGKPQKITNFSFVALEPTVAPITAAAPRVDKTAPPIPPVNLRPEQVRRTMALVVDDLGLSFESTAYVRMALKKFVDQQIQPGDLVAIIRTGGGMGALQQFTSDKRQLYAAIDRVRWSPSGRGGIGAFAPTSGDPTGGFPNSGAENFRSTNDDLENFREELFSVGTLGALNYIVRGLKDLPGRKSVLLVSDGFRISNTSSSFGPNGGQGYDSGNRVLNALRQLTDLANRASVVIYTMDARGLQTMGLTAADDTQGLTPEKVESQLNDRRSKFFDSQSGLIYLAEQTGGFAIRNQNDLSGGIKKVLNDQRGYYLIGYRPDESTFDHDSGRRKFHKLAIKLKRPGMSLRTRTGFFGISDEDKSPVHGNRIQALGAALTSPFGANGVNVRLTSLFGNDPKVGSFVRSLLHIKASDLSFTDEPDGWKKGAFDILAVTFGDNGIVLDQVNRTHTLKVKGDTYKRVMENGFDYILTVPIKKPGAYQLRAAVQDSASERVGSANQFIEVPDFKKNRLTLSGIIVEGYDPRAKNAAAGGPNTPITVEGGNLERDPKAGPAVREFKPGMIMQFGYYIYNAQLDTAAGKPQLQVQVRIFRDGQPVYTGKPVTMDAAGQPDPKRVNAGGSIQLGADMTPGDYVMQLVVTDPLAKEKYRTATQWIDFEIDK